MEVNIPTRYALIVVSYIAQHKDEGLIKSQAISKQYNIHRENMTKIMQQLVKANILRSKRGPRGGFSLARPASKITILDIIEAAEGAMDVVSHMEEYAPKEMFYKKTEQVFKKATAQIKNTLKQVKLSDLV